MRPLVSVIIPVYNVEKYLSRCLDSVLAQTYSNFEIILVDDGSTDGSGAICDQYAARDSRICVVHKDNEGVATARNIGLDAAKGELLMFVDSDDYISVDAVQTLYEAMIRDGSDLVIGQHMDVYTDGPMDEALCWLSGDRVCTSVEAFGMFEQRCQLPVCPWGKLYRRKVFESIRYPAFSCGEDAAIFPLIIEKCIQISLIKHIVYFYFQRTDSIMHVSKPQVLHDTLAANLSVAKYLWEHGYSSASWWYTRSIDRAFRYGKCVASRRLFNAYFDASTRATLWKLQKTKTRAKWFVLHIPPLRSFLYWLKRIVKPNS